MKRLSNKRTWRPRPSSLEEHNIRRTIDDDKTVGRNFQRLIWRLIQKVTKPDLLTNEIMEETIGDIQRGLNNIFEDSKSG